MNKVLEDIRIERLHQIEKGYDAAHDDRDEKGAHAQAAAYYATCGHYQRKWYGYSETPSTEMEDLCEYSEENSTGYPWPSETRSVEYSPRANLVKAAALIVAEIERIDREAAINES